VADESSAAFSRASHCETQTKIAPAPAHTAHSAVFGVVKYSSPNIHEPAISQRPSQNRKFAEIFPTQFIAAALPPFQRVRVQRRTAAASAAPTAAGRSG